MPEFTNLGQGYVFTLVCQSFCSRGGLPQPPIGRPGGWVDPPECRPPQMQTPRADLPRQTLPGCTPPVQTPQGDPPPNAGPPNADPPGIRQQAGGTHPTGMHTCSPFVSHLIHSMPLEDTFGKNVFISYLENLETFFVILLSLECGLM